MLRSIVTLFAGLVLVGCTSIPLSSIPKLASLDPRTADFAQMEVAARIPDDFLIYKDGTLLILELKTRGELSGEDVKHKLVLQPIEDELTPWLKDRHKKGFYIKRFRVNPEDVSTVLAFRAEAERRAADFPRQNEFNVAAGVNGCLAETANPFRDDRYTVYLRRSPDEDYFTLFRESPLPRSVAGDDGSGKRHCTDEDKARLF